LIVALSEVLRELVALAERVGLIIRFDAMDPRSSSRGGTCILNGRRVVVVDRRAPVADQVGVLVRALAELNLRTTYVPSLLRRRACS
jgi:hypothetical protein